MSSAERRRRTRSARCGFFFSALATMLSRSPRSGARARRACVARLRAISVTGVGHARWYRGRRSETAAGARRRSTRRYRPAPGRVADRMAPAEQEVQQHAERVDVGGGGDRRAGELLGRGVLRRQRDPPRASVCVAASPDRPRPRAAWRCRSRAASPCRRRVTSTLDGLRSRCTIRLACACATAASTSQEQRAGARRS